MSSSSLHFLLPVFQCHLKGGHFDIPRLFFLSKSTLVIHEYLFKSLICSLQSLLASAHHLQQSVLPFLSLHDIRIFFYISEKHVSILPLPVPLLFTLLYLMFKFSYSLRDSFILMHLLSPCLLLGFNLLLRFLNCGKFILIAYRHYQLSQLFLFLGLELALRIQLQYRLYQRLYAFFVWCVCYRGFIFFVLSSERRGFIWGSLRWGYTSFLVLNSQRYLRALRLLNVLTVGEGRVRTVRVAKGVFSELGKFAVVSLHCMLPFAD